MRHTRRIGVAFLLGVLVAAPVDAQAWLPSKGQGTVSVLFQNLFVEKHLGPDGKAVDAGHITSHNLLVDVTYGLTDRLTISGNVPFVSASYNGAYPHRRNGVVTLDDGHSHGTWQDFRVDVRYRTTRGGVTVTPFIGLIAPSHGYEYYAHAAPGRDIWELQIGTYVGRLITRVPGLFVQGRYGYGFAQRLQNIHHDRSVGDLELGYFIRPTVRVFGLVTGQVTHGGIDVPANFLTALPANLVQHHDQLSRANFADFGGGVQWSVRPTFDLYGSFLRTAAGVNIHDLACGVTLGATWTFGRQDVSFQSVGTKAHVLHRCVCQKGL